MRSNFAALRQDAMIWANVDPEVCHHMHYVIMPQ